jgi:hypothetical protein
MKVDLTAELYLRKKLEIFPQTVNSSLFSFFILYTFYDGTLALRNLYGTYRELYEQAESKESFETSINTLLSGGELFTHNYSLQTIKIGAELCQL